LAFCCSEKVEDPSGGRGPWQSGDSRPKPGGVGCPRRPLSAFLPLALVRRCRRRPRPPRLSVLPPARHVSRPVTPRFTRTTPPRPRHTPPIDQARALTTPHSHLLPNLTSPQPAHVLSSAHQRDKDRSCVMDRLSSCTRTHSVYLLPFFNCETLIRPAHTPTHTSVFAVSVDSVRTAIQPSMIRPRSSKSSPQKASPARPASSRTPTAR
jgi:hypothetical protein